MVNLLEALNRVNQTLLEVTNTVKEVGLDFKESVEEGASMVGNTAKEQLDLYAKYVETKVKKAAVELQFIAGTIEAVPQETPSKTPSQVHEKSGMEEELAYEAFEKEVFLRLKKLTELLQISLSATDDENIIGLCQETVLEICKKKDWATIQKIRNELKYLNINMVSIFDQLIYEGQIEVIAQAIHLNLADDLAFGNFKKSSLHHAVSGDNLPIIELLLNHIDINQKNEDQITPLQIAVLLNKKRNIDLLLKKGASLTEECPGVGSILHFSLYSLRPMLLAFPLYKHKGLLEGLDELQRKELYDSVQKGKTDLLVDALDRKFMQMAIYHRTISPIMLFIRAEKLFDSLFGFSSSANTLQYLLHNHHKKTHSLVNLGNAEGQTPLHMAAAMGHLQAIDLLYMKGANLNCKDHAGRTPMHLAAELGQIASIHRLFFLGAKVNTYDKSSSTPIDLAKGDAKKILLDIAERKGELKKLPPNFNIIPVRNLVFKGGGAKGPAYIYAIKFLAKRDKLGDLENCAGTSAGAITSTFLAFGYNAKELERIMVNTPLPDLLNSEFVATFLKEWNSSDSKVVKVVRTLKGFLKSFVKKCSDAAIKAVTAPHELAKDFAKGIYNTVHFTGILSGDKIREWIDKLIEEKTGIKYCTFKELAEGIEAGKPFKHLYLMATKISGNPEITCFNSKDEQWQNLIISDAVYASMAIPGIFCPAVLHFKDAGGRRCKNESFGKFSDGGMFANYPVQLFDRDMHAKEGEFTRPAFNLHTLGFNLFSPVDDGTLKDPSNPLRLMANLMSLYFQSQELIAKLYPEDESRTINIDHLKTPTTDFHIRGERLKKLMQSGWDCTEQFFGKEPNKLTPMFHRKDAHLIHLEPHLPYFIPRSALRGKLRQELLPPKNKTIEQVIVKKLVGVAGSGKTALACFFATEHVDRYSVVWTIDCSSEATMNESYCRLYEALNWFEEKEKETDQGDIRSRIAETLEYSSYKKPWLLIFDNVSSEITYPKRGGVVLIISRESKAFIDSDGSQFVISSEINVPFFTKQEAFLFLEKALPHENAEQKRLLIKVLNASPLEMDRAVQYMARYKISIAAYLEKLENRNFFLKENTLGPYPHSLSRIWKQTLQKVQNEWPKPTYSWLEICSFLGSEPIPIAWTQHWMEPNSSSEFLKSTSKHVLDNLLKHGLIHYNKQESSFSIPAFAKKAVLLMPLEESRIRKELKEKKDEQVPKTILGREAYVKERLTHYSVSIFSKAQEFLLEQGERFLKGLNTVNRCEASIWLSIKGLNTVNHREVNIWLIHAKHFLTHPFAKDLELDILDSNEKNKLLKLKNVIDEASKKIKI